VKFIPTLLLGGLIAIASVQAATVDPRATLVEAVLADEVGTQIERVNHLAGTGDELVIRALTAWRLSELYVYEATDGSRVPLLLNTDLDDEGRASGVALADGAVLTDSEGNPIRFLAADLTPMHTTSGLRRAIKTALDLFALGNSNPNMRRDAVVKLGQQLNPDYLPHLKARLDEESDARVQRALREAVALIRTADAEPRVRREAVRELGELRSINSLSFLQQLETDARADPDSFDEATREALRVSILQIENYIFRGQLIGTAFRGLSLAAVLLVAALGLAITFGLMGVINMAHGEMMAVGAYTTYAVQGLFSAGLMFSPFGMSVTLKGMGLTGAALDAYFLVALVASFFMAALVGLVLERGVIRFLYKRPLESLLATWGVSLVLQQIFRHTFGAANVQVSSPGWLSGSFVVQDVLFAYNRLFVVGFACFIVIGTWLLLTRTSLGLQIRAVMQNRSMASCVGVRTDRVNMMTFAFGSGLAGMAGACLSQIANVGPSLGQSYIIDCFMIVVLGGIGNLVGTVSASLGVGMMDQVLQPFLGAVMGKITVLAAIILFLQWRPAGLFATRSRNLEG
jgi:urea transport system permease protein